LSGKPLFALSTEMLARLFLLTGGRLPLIGVGGICDARTAWNKIEAGASLIQIYTALVYRGPQLIEDILLGLKTRLAESGIGSVSGVTGRRAPELAPHELSGT